MAKPFGGRGEQGPEPRLQRSPDSLAGGEGLALPAPSQEPQPAFGHYGLDSRPPPKLRSWLRPCMWPYTQNVCTTEF